MNGLFQRRKWKLTVDLGRLKEETDSLRSFLCTQVEVNVTSTGSKLLVNSENLSPNELKRLVNKYVYRRNLMNKYWVRLERTTVKLEEFKRTKKRGKRKGKETLPSTVKHGW